MFKTENAHLVPNLLTKSAQDDEQHFRKKLTLFRDSTNIKGRLSKLDKVNKCAGDQESMHYFTGVEESIDLRAKTLAQKENQSTRPTKLKNLLINFDSDDESLSEGKPQGDEQELSQKSNKIDSNEQQTPVIADKEQISHKGNNKKNCLLLMMDSDQQQQDQQPPQQSELKESKEQEQMNEEKQVASEKQPSSQKQSSKHTIQQLYSTQSVKTERVMEKQQFLLSLQQEDDCQEFSQKVDQIESMSSRATPNKKTAIRLDALQRRTGNNYYLHSIPHGKVFECVVKRDRCESLLKYHLYDCASLRNFMTVVKDEDGYLFISKELDQSNPGNVQQREQVVGRVVSNFFGTEFNCTLQNTPYLRGYRYPPKEKAEKLITIEYQTNIFGLKGPRKISAFIPTEGQKKYQNLNDIYFQQAKKKQKPTVLRFKNKTPKWCREVNAYVLNFGGRASVSSIKNFIMVGQHEEEGGSEAVLFGKFARELFNLDVRYPFSLLQGLSLALSSFDRKLACE